MTVQQPGGRERHAADVKRFMLNVNAFDTTARVLFTSCAGGDEGGGDWTRPDHVEKMCDSASPQDSHLAEHDRDVFRTARVSFTIRSAVFFFFCGSNLNVVKVNDFCVLWKPKKKQTANLRILFVLYHPDNFFFLSE